MARTTTKTCDICKRKCERIEAKLNYIPLVEGKKNRAHSAYTHHADVGECCAQRILELFNFRERMSKQEYLASRRAG